MVQTMLKEVTQQVMTEVEGREMTITIVEVTTPLTSNYSKRCQREMDPIQQKYRLFPHQQRQQLLEGGIRIHRHNVLLVHGFQN